MLTNREELLAVLGDDPGRIGRVFARHAYGMRRWVDLFSERIPATDDPETKQLLAELVAANARHMNLFRGRARAHGVDPEAFSGGHQQDREVLDGDLQEGERQDDRDQAQAPVAHAPGPPRRASIAFS